MELIAKLYGLLLFYYLQQNILKRKGIHFKMKIIHIVLGKANPNRMNGVNKVVHNLALPFCSLYIL